MGKMVRKQKRGEKTSWFNGLTLPLHYLLTNVGNVLSNWEFRDSHMQLHLYSYKSPLKYNHLSCVNTDSSKNTDV